MPIYEYRCGKCGRVYEAIRDVKKRNEPYPCELDECDGTARLLISTIHIGGDVETRQNQEKERVSHERLRRFGPHAGYPLSELVSDD